MQTILPKKTNLRLTLLGGQTFIAKNLSNNKYLVTLTDGIIKISRNSVKIYGDITPKKAYRFLGLHHNYDKIHEKLVRAEPRLEEIIQHTGTILLLQQEFLPTVISFILSANNNIKRIRKTVGLIIKKWGKPIKVNNTLKDRYLLFPDIDTLYSLNEKDLYNIGAGYRASYIISTIKLLKSSELYTTLKEMSSEKLYSEGFKLLQQLPGVGPKIADCILTFALGVTYTTPIDIWAKRYLAVYFNLAENKSYTYYRNFLTDRFGELTAFAGQYLFEYIRLLKTKENKSY